LTKKTFGGRATPLVNLIAFFQTGFRHRNDTVGDGRGEVENSANEWDMERE